MSSDKIVTYILFTTRLSGQLAFFRRSILLQARCGKGAKAHSNKIRNLEQKQQLGGLLTYAISIRMNCRTPCCFSVTIAAWWILTPSLLADDQQPMPGQPIHVTDQALREKLSVEPVKTEMVQAELPVPGVLEADPTLLVHIFPPVTGHLVKIWVQLGDTVKAGQLLATLNAPDFMSAQSDFIKARSQLNLTMKQLRREQALWDAKIAPTGDLENAQANNEQAKSDYDTALAILRSYGFDPDKDQFGEPFRLISSINGKVVEMTTGKEEFKTDTTQPLMTVADLSHVWLSANVQEKDLHFLSVGQDIGATLLAYPDEQLTGKILYIGDMLDPDTRTTKVRLLIDNPDGRFKPGMFATVLIKDIPKNEITVPTAAVVQVGNAAFVFEQTDPTTYLPRPVQLGQQHGDRVVITTGLTASAKIVVKNAVLLGQ
jgi:cobalt-zinc-cadmium efflux system membrane fusion protein